ncbi:Grx4 family monothiol glutaredoxin [Kwoniella shandongensis]|uniref:Monothiol glutaredoxin-5, mitochondrial n=1 Tax=Kwoniella shandongensis TaxID=1734106 RepID=A0A5M6BZD7_9TREE|nr:Grx4 family monothiol glutaredoxin [Kwoniella shandongensis]KAA5528217.1 Grx4 family monothiol glutaredoxin [Kwoniella shandongensis]
MSFARLGLRTLRSLPSAQVSRSSNILNQRRFLSDEARKLIDNAVQSNPLVLFMKGTPEAPQCGFSRAVCQILDVQGVPRENIKAYNCLEDQELREGIKEYSEWPTIPQVYIKGEFVGGCDILLSMHQSGELETLLIKEGLAPELPADEPVAETKA